MRKGIKNQYRDKLRLDSSKNLRIIPVNRMRENTLTKEIWYKNLALEEDN